MSESVSTHHVYQRDITSSQRSSLSTLAHLISPGTQVLDLGCGTGALGRWLNRTGGNILDGVTLSPLEAEQARPAYRKLVVGDLETLALSDHFDAGHYDFVVCADVLEHLKQPERTLRVCRDLLKPSGRLLVSVPNASYAGLVAELMHGRFDYRDEGLLDRTHLRFFTRSTLASFLDAEGWCVESLEPIDRALPESEFNLAFDSMPPAVSRYLLAMDDALTYQFVVCCASVPLEKTRVPISEPDRAHGQALFSAQLYLGQSDGFREEKKINATGQIGNPNQTLFFELGDNAVNTTRLRLDPADRPGFLHLHAVRLLSHTHGVAWEWRGGTTPHSALDRGDVPCSQICWHLPGMALPTPMLLLLGDDPWFELPIPSDVISSVVASGGALEVDLGWPMAADYLVASRQMAQLSEALTVQSIGHQLALQNYEASVLKLKTEVDALDQELHAITKVKTETEAALSQRLLEAKAQAAQASQVWQIERAQLLGGERQLRLEKARVNEQLDQLRNHLKWIENSTVFRSTRPLVNAKMALQQLLSKPAAPPAHPHEPSGSTTVDVIVPVYKGLFDTQRCIQSVLASTCKTAYRLIVINDASPEPQVTQWLREVASNEPRITLLENPHNLGFVATVNRGMAHGTEHDVLLLNSDTEVANDWLDRLVHAAYSQPRVASVTPFSNNATICSYPRFCQPNPLPPGQTTAGLDALCAATNPGAVLEVPTGVGFCMYIRRACLNQVGLFDVDNFGKGYGEENDFCCRAIAAGWRNLQALDTFVLHAGGVSFGDSKSAREQAAMNTLRRLHPHYETDVLRFVQADPAKDYRHAIDLTRLAQSPLPKVLAITHDRAGGTLRHVRELSQTLRDQALFLCLTPLPDNKVLLQWVGEDEGLRLEFSHSTDANALIHTLKSARVTLVHFHHLLGHNAVVQAIPQQLGVPFDFTVHDHYTQCPQISLTDHRNRYCGEEGEAQCTACLRRSPAPGGVDIVTWRRNQRSFLVGSRHILAPSRDAAQRIHKLVPAANIREAPHTDIPRHASLPTPSALLRPGTHPLKVVVIGALSTIKGADLLEDVAMAAKKADSPIEFHLVGYAYRSLKTRPTSCLTVHGEYKEAELPDMLAWLKPDLVWFPALWPETYSYTLSACLEAGLPVVAPNLGAFAQRLHLRGWSWVQPWDTSVNDWLAFFNVIHRNHFIPHLPPAVFVDSASPDQARSDWDYHTDYLSHLPEHTYALAAVVAPPSASWLHTYRGGHASPGMTGVGASVRTRLLTAVVRLRSMPALRGLARAIPLRWQTRVKTWLLK